MATVNAVTPESIGRAQWLEERRAGIGGTDAAAILGLSRYENALDVWSKKRREAPEKPATPPMRWGLALEEAIALAYTETTGRAVWNPERIVRHAEHEVLLGTPDRLVIGQPRGLELKTANAFNAHEWGEEGTDEIPAAYIVQCLHYLEITGFSVWDVAVLIGGSDFRIYTVRGDEDVQRNIVNQLLAWWKRHIEDGERPDIDGSESARSYLSRVYPVESGDVVAAPPDADPLARGLAEARAALDVWEERKTLFENQLKAMIGTRSGFDSPAWRATWRAVKGRTTTDWESIAKALAQSLDQEFVNDAIRAHTKEGAGYRRFLFTPRKEKSSGSR